MSLSEAAFVIGVPTREVNTIVDEREIELLPSRRPAGSAERRERFVGARAVAYLALRCRYQEMLSPNGRRALYEALRPFPDTWQTLLAPPAKHISLGLGLLVTLEPTWQQFRERLATLESANAWVESNPHINGGDPVVRGTRVSVAVLADLVKQGAMETEILEDFPSLTIEGVRAALQFAALHPRRGRPPGTRGRRAATFTD